MALLFFFGAAGKSAQFPLHVWLPDAMEGPTPVSRADPRGDDGDGGRLSDCAIERDLRSVAPASVVVASVGAFTAIFAAATALVHTDIKRVLAYSTVSQLGFMFLALGVGAWWVAVFHLFTHAFFKALLFLGAGSIIHALDGEQDLRKMGGLRQRMPVTYWTMFVGAVALSGIPGSCGILLERRHPEPDVRRRRAAAVLRGRADQRPHRYLYVATHASGVLSSSRRRKRSRKRAHESSVADGGSAGCAGHRQRDGGMDRRSRFLERTAWMHSFEHWLAPVFAQFGAHRRRPRRAWNGC